MPMLDIQKRHADVFRLRLGDRSAKGFPQKLTDSIRVTSPNQSVVAAFVDVYGGEVKAWEQQWEAYLPTMALPVMVLPGQSITQWWESYRKTVCERRCDGITEQLSGEPCMCPADIVTRMQTKDACRPMTRINIACPEVAVVGAGSLVTHGMIAAETLPQSVAIAEAALSRGLMVPAVLRVIVHEGKKHYVVPQLEIVGVSIAQLETGEVERPALAAAPAPALSPPAPRAIAAPSRPTDSGPRRPAVAPPLPNDPEFDVDPPAPADEWDVIALTKRIEALDDDQRAVAAERWKAANLPPRTHADFSKDHVDTAESILMAIEEEATATYDRRRKHVNAKMGEVGVRGDEARHELVRHATDGRTDSTKRLAHADVDAIVAYCAAMAAEDAKHEAAS